MEANCYGWSKQAVIRGSDSQYTHTHIHIYMYIYIYVHNLYIFFSWNESDIYYSIPCHGWLICAGDAGDWG